MMNMNTYYYLYYPNELHPTHKARKWNADHTSCVLATVLAYCTSFNGKNNYQYFQLCSTSISCLLVSCSCLQLQCPCPPTSQLVAAAGVLFECTSEIFLVSDFYFSSIFEYFWVLMCVGASNPEASFGFVFCQKKHLLCTYARVCT